MPGRPWIEDFSSGYMQRMMPMMPRQGAGDPWVNPQRYSHACSGVMPSVGGCFK